MPSAAGLVVGVPSLGQVGFSEMFKRAVVENIQQEFDHVNYLAVLLQALAKVLPVLQAILSREA